MNLSRVLNGQQVNNPRLTKPFSVTRVTKGGGYHPCELEN